MAPLPCSGLVARGAAGSRGAGTLETPPPPAGKIAPQLFCFPRRVPAAEPAVRTRVCGPGRRGGAGSGDSSAWGVRAEIASLLPAGRALGVHVQSSRARLGSGLEQGPRLGCIHSCLTPDAKAAGGPGPGCPCGRPRVGTPAGAAAERRAASGCLGRVLLFGLRKLSAGEGRRVGTGLLRAAVGPRPSLLWGCWTCQAVPRGGRRRGELSSPKRWASGLGGGSRSVLNLPDTRSPCRQFPVGPSLNSTG